MLTATDNCFSGFIFVFITSYTNIPKDPTKSYFMKECLRWNTRLLMVTEYWRMSDDSALIVLSESDYKMNFLFSFWVMTLSAVCISISSAVNTMDSLRFEILLFSTKEILTWSIEYDASAKVDKQSKLGDENRLTYSSSWSTLVV